MGRNSDSIIEQAMIKMMTTFGFFFFALLLMVVSPVIAQDAGYISVRNLKEIAVASPVMMAASARDDSSRKYAEEKISETKQDTGQAKPETKSPDSQDSGEFGDVTPEQLGTTPNTRSSDEYGDVASEEGGVSEGTVGVYDPIRPFNTAMYKFNDTLYFWALKPVSSGYKAVFPEEIRGIFGNFYENLKAPIRIVNNLLQGDAKHAGSEFVSLLINSTIGVGGLRNCAEECFGIQRNYADFGQTLGKWGFGYGFYLVIPFLGPSSARDGIGLAFDWPMRPTSYVGEEFLNEYNVGLYVHERVNYTSFHIGEYEALKNASVDPYVAMREIYIEYRNNLITKP